LTFLMTLSTLNPYSSVTIFLFADAPNVSMDIIFTSSPVYLCQPKEDVISIATLLVTVFGSTVSLYSEDCCSNLSQDGILTTLVSIFSSHNASCALIARLTSDPVASNIASIFSFSLLMIYAPF